jgi:hypothetical protein
MRGGLGKAPVCNVSSMEDAVRTGAIYTRAAMYVDGEQLLALIQLSTCQFEVWRCLASTLTSALKPRLYVCDAFRPLTCAHHSIDQQGTKMLLPTLQVCAIAYVYTGICACGL